MYKPTKQYIMATKLTEQEIEAIKGFQQKTQNVIMDLGKIELQMNDLLSVKEKVKEAILEGEIANKYEATYQFMLKRAAKLGLQINAC